MDSQTALHIATYSFTLGLSGQHMDYISFTFYLFYVYECRHLCLCITCMCLVPVEPEEGVRSTGTSVVDGY